MDDKNLFDQGVLQQTRETFVTISQKFENFLFPYCGSAGTKLEEVLIIVYICRFWGGLLYLRWLNKSHLFTKEANCLLCCFVFHPSQPELRDACTCNDQVTVLKTVAEPSMESVK